jgi:hypothetical protein
MSTPDPPVPCYLAGPPGCCPPCVACSGTQPSVSVVTTGPEPPLDLCNNCDGSMAFTSFTSGAGSCTWEWAAIGECAGQYVRVSYDEGSGLFDIAVTSAFGGASGVPLSCVNGIITGVVVLPGVEGCTGVSFTLTFG